MFWKIYFWSISLLAIAAYASEGLSDVWDAIDLITFIGALVGLYSYAYGKRILTAQFWKIYLPTYLVWDLTSSLIIYPLTTGESFDITLVIASTIVVPLYIALYRYAYIFFEGNNSGEYSTSVSASQTHGAREVEYPTILRRYLATFIDALLVLSTIIIAAYIFQENEGISQIARITLIVIMVLVYEPICTSRFCTVGQKLTGIRIRTLGTHERIHTIAAYIRIIAKLFLGIISFFSIPFTEGKRALHDFAVNSIVIYAHQDKGKK